ncbi:ABC transporter substrate-binding protein [Brooklawnia cerclae]|uniref:Peptide/nickel transport system substrate-binding protein n=1 Tax=Brooklawnia cerclae TaxID=349934 RepID=A0ABX0SHM4_9ACTN|nr:ABC transporter substrate-binding protein [Brooklawnia cerclae]NIH57905.1 peptide/nickel transport system substrate-binding protein [Brooklawnia cerclae]
MRTMLRRLAAVLLPLSLVLTACGGGGSTSPSDAASAQTGGEINIAWPSQPPTLDPVVVTTSATNTIAYNVFEGLVALDANYDVQPMLAESWSTNDDYSEFTFKLRTGITFHNGQTMTTDDVIASINYWIQVTSAGQQFFADAEVTAPDADTVVIKLPQTLYTGIYYLAQPTQQLVIMPATSIEKAVASTGVPQEDLFGTGPFKIESMTVDQQIVLSRFDGYVARDDEASGIVGKKEPMADKLIFNIVPDATTRVNGIMSGEYDYATDIPADNASQLASTSGVTLNTLNSGILAMVFNKKQGAFADEKLRQAVQMAINAEDVLNASYNSTDYYELNGALAATTQKDWYTDAGLDAYNQNDIEGAKELVAESGYNGEEITFVTTRDYPYMYNSAVVVADVLKELGLNVNLQVTDWASELKLINDPAGFDLFVSDFLKRPIPSAYTYLTPTYAGWSDDSELADAIAQVNAATSSDEGLAAMANLQEVHYSYVPAVKFGDIRAITAQRDTVGGFVSFIGPVFYNSYRVN